MKFHCFVEQLKKDLDSIRKKLTLLQDNIKQRLLKIHLGDAFMSELGSILRQEFKDKEYAHAYVEDFLNTSIATQIKVLREQRGWSQTKLAEEAGMKHDRISVLEDANYSSWSINVLRKLAKAFDLVLKVSFENFAPIINEISNLSRKSLERITREEELEREDQPLDRHVHSLASWLAINQAIHQSIDKDPYSGNFKQLSNFNLRHVQLGARGANYDPLSPIRSIKGLYKPETIGRHETGFN